MHKRPAPQTELENTAPLHGAGALDANVRRIHICLMVLVELRTIKEAATFYSISAPRAREIIHSHCRKTNKTLYENLLHATEYEGGYTNEECLPFLKQLREHSSAFLRLNA